MADHDRSHAPRGNAPRTLRVPNPSAGLRVRNTDRPHAPRGNAAQDAPRLHSPALASESATLIVPTLRVVTHLKTLRVSNPQRWPQSPQH
jgi:hypothetical protein